jgi:hypothetical protein
MKGRIFLFFIVFLIVPLTSFTPLTSLPIEEEEERLTLESYARSIYQSLNFTDYQLDYTIFKKGITGYLNMKDEERISDKEVLTIVDFSVSSSERRMWVIDLKEKKIAFNTLVAHGKGTGNEFARNFSNIPGSHQSSIGFFVTGEMYNGDNGLSLKLHGLEKGVNDNARRRSVVIHGADYATEKFMKANGGVLGRSFGCPAVPMGIHKPIINNIADKTCLFIYFPESRYLSNSKWLQESKSFSGKMGTITTKN